MADGKIKPEGLTGEFIKRVCWAGEDNSKYCRYLRCVRGVWVCAKGTAAGIRHSERIDRLLRQGLDEAGEVVFDSGDDVKLPDEGRKMNIHAGDNCEGRSGEFLHLFPQGEVS